ncbi:MAG: ethanolamine ammonia-lyase subunit EutC [Synergistetes bacterium]|nr:ethanolamine ammonia-lyase subunit EutC [Synergistota bacterium]MCX8127749.1 ethanolamine ammonia-lyase subunit EutC [Synergistota bacterium]MDW8191336.1 ethanolamine ammonia-lyase subunit EutC [Synergistota bacterium]
MITEKELREIVESVIKELSQRGKAPVTTVSSGKEKEGLSSVEEACLPDLADIKMEEWCLVPNAVDPEGLKRIKSTTPARIGLWRVGARYKLEPWLRFRMDLAAAKDAVMKEVDPKLIEELGMFTVQTMVKDKDEHLTRPDLGRKLSPEAKEKILASCQKNPQVQLIVVDGLSSTAIEANIRDFLPSFYSAIKGYGLSLGTPFFVKYGRVAIMDEIGELLQPEVLVELIGERPGLVTAKSMSAYMCYRPNKSTIESDRTLVSNIHDRGLSPIEAGAHVASIVKKIYDAKMSGVKLAAMEG